MYLVIFITAKDKIEARKIAQGLIQDRLVACVNIVEKVESLFWWQAKVERAREALLIVKTKKKLLNKLIRLVKSLHSYKVAEIIALPIIGGNSDYLNWIDDVTK